MEQPLVLTISTPTVVHNHESDDRATEPVAFDNATYEMSAPEDSTVNVKPEDLEPENQAVEIGVEDVNLNDDKNVFNYENVIVKESAIDNYIGDVAIVSAQPPFDINAHPPQDVTVGTDFQTAAVDHDKKRSDDIGAEDNVSMSTDYDEDPVADENLQTGVNLQTESVHIVFSGHANGVMGDSPNVDDKARLLETRRKKEKDLTICMGMFVVVMIIFVLGLVIHFTLDSIRKYGAGTDVPQTTEFEGLSIVARDVWGALSPIETEPLPTPTPYAIVHHTDGWACNSFEECKEEVLSIQNFHMDDRGWWDIGYNFLIGGDGNVYEGRGWDIKGAHARSYNQYSIGISMMGNYSFNLPSESMLNALDRLLALLLDESKLDPCYTLYGHRQAVATTCPGETLYSYLQAHPHWRFDDNSVGYPDPNTPCD